MLRINDTTQIKVKITRTNKQEKYLRGLINTVQCMSTHIPIPCQNRYIKHGWTSMLTGKEEKRFENTCIFKMYFEARETES